MSLLGIPFDFVLFALTLLGVALLPPPHAARWRSAGALAITLYKLLRHRLQGRRRHGRPGGPRWATNG